MQPVEDIYKLGLCKQPETWTDPTECMFGEATADMHGYLYCTHPSKEGEECYGPCEYAVRRNQNGKG